MTRLKYVGLGLLVATFMPVAIWVAAGSALYQGRTKARRLESASCSTDADCPPGYACVGGRCLPEGSQ